MMMQFVMQKIYIKYMNTEQCGKISIEAATGSVLWKNVFLKISQNSQENACVWVSFNKIAKPETCNFITWETLTQVVFCEFCEIFEKIYFVEHLQIAASVSNKATP